MIIFDKSELYSRLEQQIEDLLNNLTTSVDETIKRQKLELEAPVSS